MHPGKFKYLDPKNQLVKGFPSCTRAWLRVSPRPIIPGKKRGKPEKSNLVDG